MKKEIPLSFCKKNLLYNLFRWKGLILLAAISFFCNAATYSQTCAVPGKDGPATVSGVVNTYFPSPANSTATGKNIPVGAVTNLESGSTPIAAGDLLLIIQMQDATINTSNSSSYGAGTGTGNGFTGGNAGYYEYTVATNSVSTSGGTIITVQNLTRSYYSDTTVTTTRGKQNYQVIRVPQYSALTISGTVRAAAWDGISGGILAVDVAGTLNLNSGTITAAGKGFRAGQGRSATGGSGTNADYRVASSNLSDASKGEGIVGTPRYVYDGVSSIDTAIEGYPSGSYARGAPGNAGGGGTDGNPTTNDQNSGGGGGGNGGAGGQGGNSWSSNLNVGGIGGASFPAGVTRFTMGGGGGAGSTNNGADATSSGGNGGGIILIRAGAVSGTGTINVNGTDAPNSNPNCCGDGGGGGGAGGSIIVLAGNTSGLTGITATAKGGKGGDTLVAASSHGPGGGGGGGVILSNGSLGSNDKSGGANGTTYGGIAYNAQSGVTGVFDASLGLTSIPGTSSGTQCVPSLTVTKSTSTPTLTNSSTGTVATYKITVANAANRADATQIAISDTLPQPVTNGFRYAATSLVTLNGSATRPTITNPAVNDTVPAWSSFTIPAGSSVEITFTINIASNVGSGTYQNPATATYLDPTRTVTNGTTTANYNSASSTAEDVTISSRPNVGLVKSCPLPANCLTTSQLPDTDLTYQITFTNTGSLSAASMAIVDGVPANTDYKLGSATVSPGTTGLTMVIEYSNDYDPLNPTLATWVYTPVSAGGGAAAGYDRLVKAVRWRVTAGTLSNVSPNNTGNVSFIAKIR